MAATVKVSERTLQLLNKLKKEIGARSHNHVIRELIRERENENAEIHVRFKPTTPFLLGRR